jgi:hypothetical protein
MVIEMSKPLIEAFDFECVSSLKLIVHKDRRTDCPKSNKRTVIHLPPRILLHCNLCNLDIVGQGDRLAKETIFNEDRQLISIQKFDHPVRQNLFNFDGFTRERSTFLSELWLHL